MPANYKGKETSISRELVNGKKTSSVHVINFSPLRLKDMNRGKKEEFKFWFEGLKG